MFHSKLLQHIPVPFSNGLLTNNSTLSRVTPLEFQDSNAEKDILAVNLLQYSSIEEKETVKDKELQSLKHYISTEGHQGIKACRSRAREFVFWVNINEDLKELVEKCDLCQSQQNSISTVQKYVSEVPPHPWHTIVQTYSISGELTF